MSIIILSDVSWTPHYNHHLCGKPLLSRTPARPPPAVIAQWSSRASWAEHKQTHHPVVVCYAVRLPSQPETPLLLRQLFILLLPSAGVGYMIVNRAKRKEIVQVLRYTLDSPQSLEVSLPRVTSVSLIQLSLIQDRPERNWPSKNHELNLTTQNVVEENDFLCSGDRAPAPKWLWC